MIDVGVVQYQLNRVEKRMHAVWYSSTLDTNKTGTGITELCDVDNGFSGTYKIQYTDHLGKNLGVFDLRIEKSGEIYELYWMKNDRVIFVGVGIETPEGLSAGWRKQSSM